ncbi:hypothetical protein HQQ80_13875 [Microbacteriaceae bacterium VKM Ac-2855]|nr:hypothetical protein [Microbacteriaceae bacterium VKM Ac-2855]
MTRTTADNRSTRITTLEATAPGPTDRMHHLAIALLAGAFWAAALVIGAVALAAWLVGVAVLFVLLRVVMFARGLAGGRASASDRIR